VRSGLHARARVTLAPRGLEAPSAGRPRLCRFTPPPSLDKRHLRRYARAWAHPPLAWPVGSIGSDGEPARGIASSEDSYDQTVTGCEVARGCPVAGRHQCLQTIGVTATTAGLHRERVRENPSRGAAVLARPHFKATWVQNERLWLPPAPSLWQADTSGMHEAQQEAFPLDVQKMGPHTTRGRPFPPSAGAVFPDGSACVSCPRVMGVLAAVPGARRPVRPSASVGGGRPFHRCWTMSSGCPRLAKVRVAGRPMERQCGAKRGGVRRAPVFGVQRWGAAVPTGAQQTKSCSSTVSNKVWTDFHWSTFRTRFTATVSGGGSRRGLSWT